MRTLLYFRTHFDDLANTGVTDKCKAIAAGFGSDCDLWYFTTEGLRHEGTAKTPSFDWSAPKHALRHLLLYYFYADKYLMQTIDFRQYTCFYIRHLPAHPLFLQLLKQAKKQNPNLTVLIELPTWPYDSEMKGIKARFASILDKIYRKKMAKYCDYFIHFGPETEIMGVPTIRMSNGIEVAKKPLRTPTKAVDGSLRLLAVGNWAFTLGLERILYGMPAYIAAGKKVQLTIVGQGPALADLKQLTNELQLQDEVLFHPPCTGAEYDHFFEEADVAVGKLFIPVKGLAATSSLRHRDYCARGIPFVLAGQDTDIETTWPFALHFPHNDSPISIQQIEDFYCGIRTNYPDYGDKMRQFALEHLDWSGKIQKMIQSIQTKI